MVVLSTLKYHLNELTKFVFLFKSGSWIGMALCENRTGFSNNQGQNKGNGGWHR